MAAHKLPHTGPPGAVYSDELFTHERGQATIFLPCTGEVRPLGRVTPAVIPAKPIAFTCNGGSNQRWTWTLV